MRVAVAAQLNQRRRMMNLTYTFAKFTLNQLQAESAAINRTSGTLLAPKHL